MTASAEPTTARPLSADDLLAGPRGRRVCLEILFQLLDVWQVPWTAGETPEVMARGLARVLDGVGLVAASRCPEEGSPTHRGTRGETPSVASFGSRPVDLDLCPRAVSLALTASVDAARYWQEPDEWDLALALPEARAALLPVARLLVAAPATGWWTDRLDLDDLHEVEMLDDPPSGRAPTTGARARLARWRTEQEEQERQHVEADRGLAHTTGGDWWSTPLRALPTVTAPYVAGLGPAGLSYAEDSFGWSEARSWPRRAPRSARSYEIDGPDDLTALASRFPLDVARSRRGTWWETTGVDVAWVMPDWYGVAHEYDAVHLTVRGYLMTAGTAVPVHGTPVSGTCTVLAGWAPGDTVWLTDDMAEAGPPSRWRRHPDEVLWDLVTDETP